MLLNRNWKIPIQWSNYNYDPLNSYIKQLQNSCLGSIHFINKDLLAWIVEKWIKIILSFAFGLATTANPNLYQ